MHPTLLQVEAVTQLSSYGPIGLLASLFISAIIYLEKIRRAKEAETAKRLSDQQLKMDRLEERIDKILTEDHKQMLAVIQHNTDIMEEVVSTLQRNKH